MPQDRRSNHCITFGDPYRLSRNLIVRVQKLQPCPNSTVLVLRKIGTHVPLQCDAVAYT